MTEHRISLPQYAKTFLASATRVHTERVIVMFHRWLLERCMELSAVTGKELQDFLNRPSGQAIKPRTANSYRWPRKKTLDLLLVPGDDGRTPLARLRESAIRSSPASITIRSLSPTAPARHRGRTRKHRFSVPLLLEGRTPPVLRERDEPIVCRFAETDREAQTAGVDQSVVEEGHHLAVLNLKVFHRSKHCECTPVQSSRVDRTTRAQGSVPKRGNPSHERHLACRLVALLGANEYRRSSGATECSLIEVTRGCSVISSKVRLRFPSLTT